MRPETSRTVHELSSVTNCSCESVAMVILSETC
jgi:hypothetical protein